MKSFSVLIVIMNIIHLRIIDTTIDLFETHYSFFFSETYYGNENHKIK